MIMSYLKRTVIQSKGIAAVLGLALPLVVAACSSGEEGIKGGTAGNSGGSGGSGGSTGGSGGSIGGSGGSTGGSGGSTGGSGGSTGGTGGTGGTIDGGGKGGAAGATGGTAGTGGAAGSGATSGAGGSAGKADGGATGGTAGTAGTAGTGGAGGADGGAPDSGTGGTGGGTTDGGVVVPPGDPIVVPDMVWRAVPTTGAICRDRSATGFAVNFNMASDKLIIFMEGGGACFNGFTCGANPRTWAPTDANANVGSRFVLNRTAATNPFREWNMAYIPYCTGDVHTGTNMAGFNGDAHMGYSNYLKYLGRLVATLKSKPLTQIVLTGISAGGFGTAWNWMVTEDAFGVPVQAIDDSGPPFGATWLSACHQQRTATLWGWSGSVHPSCTNCDLTTGNVVIPLVEAAMRRQTARFGLVSYDEDGTIKTFLAYGLNNCANWDALLPPAFPAGQFPMGLADLRTRWMSNTNAAMYVVPGGSHTFLGSDLSGFRTGTNITMLEWVTKLVTNDTGWTNVNP
jgi:hypothetical protein